MNDLAEINFCRRCGVPRKARTDQFCEHCGLAYTMPADTTVPAATAQPSEPSNDDESGFGDSYHEENDADWQPDTVGTPPTAPAICILAGAAVTVVGSFTPWVTIQTAFGSIARSGTDGNGDGLITLILGGLLVLGEIINLTAKRRSGTFEGMIDLLLSIIVGFVAGYDINNVNQRAASLSSNYASAGVGYGLYLVALGALIIAVGSIMRMAMRERNT
jgi:hypothetical protein